MKNQLADFDKSLTRYSIYMMKCLLGFGDFYTIVSRSLLEKHCQLLSQKLPVSMVSPKLLNKWQSFTGLGGWGTSVLSVI